MPRLFSWPFWAAMSAVLLVAAAFAREQPPSPGDNSAPQSPAAEKPVPTPAAPPSAPASRQQHFAGTRPSKSTANGSVVAEITTIRGQQGGLLRGSLLESLSQPDSGDHADGDEFASALSRIVERSSGRAFFPCDVQYLDAEGPPLTTPPAVGDEQLVDLLRQTSRALDSRSHDFESARQFQRADQLQNLAQRLRRQARTLEAGR